MVVNPEAVSKKASRKWLISPVSMKGRVPKIDMTNQESPTAAKPSFVVRIPDCPRTLQPTAPNRTVSTAAPSSCHTSGSPYRAEMTAAGSMATPEAETTAPMMKRSRRAMPGLPVDSLIVGVRLIAG